MRIGIGGEGMVGMRIYLEAVQTVISLFYLYFPPLFPLFFVGKEGKRKEGSLLYVFTT